MALPENLHEAICAWNYAKPGSEAAAAYASILRAYQQAVDVAVSNAVGYQMPPDPSIADLRVQLDEALKTITANREQHAREIERLNANLATARACAEAETLRWVIEELAKGRR